MGSVNIVFLLRGEGAVCFAGSRRTHQKLNWDIPYMSKVVILKEQCVSQIKYGENFWPICAMAMFRIINSKCYGHW
jgi:hypothetical protein